MSAERPQEIPPTPASQNRQTPDDRRVSSEGAGTQRPSDGTAGREATVLVRGETIRAQEPKSPPKDKSPPREVSADKVKLQSRLPVLDDDSELGVQKEQIAVRDGKADITFTGKLLASAAPASAPQGQWQEYRVYETDGGKHVFSKVARSVFAEQQDTHEAELYDPSPASKPLQLLRSARDLARSHPYTWADAAAAFFGYDPLAKALYRKLGHQFEQHIS
jgi:hypothetical protein